MIIIWLMYLTLSVFCVLDYFSTKALLEFGYTEANPILLLLINSGTDFEHTLYIKTWKTIGNHLASLTLYIQSILCFFCSMAQYSSQLSVT